jgi:hypothetical protein
MCDTWNRPTVQGTADYRGPKGHAAAAPLLQRRRRHRRRAGVAGPAATTSVFTAGQPHAPQDVDQCPARPSCSFIAGPCTHRRSHARQPELRDSRRRARRWGSCRPGFSFRGEVQRPSSLSSTGVDEETASPASSMVTEVRGPAAALIPICAGGRALAASEDEEAAGVAPNHRRHRRPCLPASCTSGAGGGPFFNLHRTRTSGGRWTGGGADLQQGRRAVTKDG